VRNRNTSFFSRWFSLIFLMAAVVLTMVQLVGYSRQRSSYPPGMTIAGVPIGGLDPPGATQRLLQVYSNPVEIQYAGAVIHIDPNLVGFEMDLERMLTAADQARSGDSFWGGFWNYLWNREAAEQAIPLSATVNEERLRAYLRTEISSRYDQPATPAQPIPGGVTFTPGQPGQELDIDRAVLLIEEALRSPTSRVVVLSFQRTDPTRPSYDNLEILLQQIINLSGFDGVIGLYLYDLQTGQEMHFALNNGFSIPVNPDVAFSASSTVKVPVMVSYFARSGPVIPDQRTSELLTLMITRSDNEAPDELMRLIDPIRGPLVVSEDMDRVGLENTFIAAFFALGSPALDSFRTPANQRFDVVTNPDPVSQTTPSDIGMLLVDIYQCAENGGGALVAAFPGRITAEICNQMIGYLVQNNLGALIEAGVPDGTQVAHKHGWVIDPFTQLMSDVSDAGIVYTPGGNYVLAVYAYHPVQALWEPTSRLFAEISQAVYNYYNLPTQ